MKTYTIVFYKWWMDSGHFIEETMDEEDIKVVEQYAAAKCYHNCSTFQHWAYHIVKDK